MSARIVAFLAGMWLLMLAGGGIAVLVLGPISVTGLGGLDDTVSSVIQAAAAAGLVAAWIAVLSGFKGWMFRRAAG